MTESELAGSGGISKALSHIGVIILAAGQSQRMGGEHKLIRTICGVPVLQRVISCLKGTGLCAPVVVTGYERDRLVPLIPEDVRQVHNEDFTLGMGGSVACGVAAIESSCEAVLILMGDMPCLKQETLVAIASTYSDICPQIIIPTFQSRRGNPVLWSSDFFPELKALRGHEGGRQLFARHQEALVEKSVNDKGILIDVDDESALDRARAYSEIQGGGGI